MPAGAVATVGETTITQSSFDRWARIAARSLGYRAVPRPPSYRACVKGEKRGPVTRRKTRCANRFRAIRNDAMAFLIGARWLELETAERAIVVTVEEVEQEFTRRRDQFPNDAAYLDFKSASGKTDGDIRFTIRVDLLTQRLRDAALSESGATTDQAAALERFVAAYRAKWVARTACARYHRMSDCGA